VDGPSSHAAPPAHQGDDGTHTPPGPHPAGWRRPGTALCTIGQVLEHTAACGGHRLASQLDHCSTPVPSR